MNATVRVPGSKSETNRALVLAALASGPSVITGGLDARDTRLMRQGLRAFGVSITEHGDRWEVQPPGVLQAGDQIDCGLAGTVMRFLPPVAALADGRTRFDGDEAARARPMEALLSGLRDAGADITGDTENGDAQRLPVTVTGDGGLTGGDVRIDASASSQFVSGLLLAAPRFANGVDLRHTGDDPVPSKPNIDMTVAMLRDRGVDVDDSEPDRWVVRPGEISGGDIAIAPDLANAAPFLAAAAITGGRVTVPDWPEASFQPGAAIVDLLEMFDADVGYADGQLTVRGNNELQGFDADLHDASELTPVVAALAALAEQTTHIHGVGHIRGHETDRLAALEEDLTSIGVHAHQTEDGLVIHPKLLYGNVWRSYQDHRIATAGALLGLVVDDLELDDISCVDKTMPEFVAMWTAMLEDSAAAEGVAQTL
jgi:3-phosphoshikimate 1-carboxyvinyltransferase